MVLLRLVERKCFHRFDKYLNFSNPLIAETFDPHACGWAYGMNVFDKYYCCISQIKPNASKLISPLKIECELICSL